MAALGMSFGGDLNAHTDFHETVYTLSCPVKSHLESEEIQVGGIAENPVNTDAAEVPPSTTLEVDAKVEDVPDTWDGNVYRCINLLRELGRQALLEEGPTYANEKLAVISEEQMRNTIEYRVQERLLKQLHSTTVLPKR